jgi:hypothetical protein
MAGLTASGATDLLNGARTNFTHLSLHTADPGATGTSEISGGAYARKSIPWDAAPSAGRLDTQADIVFDGPASQVTVTHVGYWTALTGGTFKNSFALSQSRQIGPGDTLTIQTNDLALILTLTS